MVNESAEEGEVRDLSPQETLKAKEAIQRLLSSEGWTIIQRWATTQREARLNQILYSTDKSQAEDYFLKGECAALKLILQFPQALLEQYENELKDIEE